MIRPMLTASLMLAALPVWAENLRVVTDTGPVHALVSRVMAGVGTPARLLPPGASPHDFQLRLSDAAGLQEAQVVIWMGAGLAPWLAEPLATLAPDAVTLEMLATTGWAALPRRTDAAFQTDHGDHATDSHDHAADDVDPHVWLDPAIAAIWLEVIAATLSDADPDNAALYAANANTGQAEYAALQAELAVLLSPVQGRPYIVPHDALQYFEVAFGMPAAGAIALSDASAPGPARIAALQELVASEGAVCILTDPETASDWATLLADAAIVQIAKIDPDGANLPPGADLYPALMRGLAEAVADCLAGGG